MGDTKVSDLPAITLPLAGNDILYIVDASTGTSNKITYTNLRAPLDATANQLTFSVNSLSADVLSLSATFESANIDIGPLTTDILELSGQVQTISANQDEIIYTDMAWLCANIDINKSYVEQVSSTPSTTSTLTATHYVNVDLGGTTYKMLLAVEL